MLGPGFQIKNETQWPLTTSLNQVGPLYYGLCQSGETFTRKTGAVWFTIKACISADNKCHINDWDCVWPIASIVGSVLLGAITGGYGAFAGVAASIGASALVSGGLVSLTGIVIEGAVLSAVTPGVAASLIAKIFEHNSDTSKMGCYAGGPWPFRSEIKQYRIVGGPEAILRPDGKMELRKGQPLRII